MPEERFSKKRVADYISHQMARAEERFGFDPNDGYRQVAGKGEDLNREYGAYSALQDLLEHLGLRRTDGE